MVQGEVPILENREIARDYYQLVFKTTTFGKGTVLPGQFLTIRISDSTAPLLRRPFAFSSWDNDTASIIYQRRGPGTEALAGKHGGDKIDIIAPLGNSWPAPAAGETAVLVAGGIGMGPILFQAAAYKAEGISFKLIVGARTSAFLPSDGILEELDAVIATDDGSRGLQGTVSNALETLKISKPHYYACGPHPMMKAVHDRAVIDDNPCTVSMEQTMACGVGACMGCVIQLTGTDRYARVCADGPIFDSREILWT